MEFCRILLKIPEQQNNNSFSPWLVVIYNLYVLINDAYPGVFSFYRGFPFTIIETKGIGTPFSSVTLPVIDRTCANSGPVSSSMLIASINVFLMCVLYLVYS
ncbi:hypothetical protein D3H65_07320 [Paraflavitalea soli]|uniref:Uncharacterized protein n=1 Tax=Paraflavitalea soli TaxID=2315862 RepID=A0A3B7MJK2_9BACT|nr:hypothetical protein D3H65_07320 [Paraflavitalea soli]